MRLADWQKQRLVSVWEEYLSRQESSGDNQYGTALGQMKILESYVEPPATVVFIGCGDGLEVVEAKKLGYNAYGVTLGDPDVIRAKHVYNLDLIKCDAHLLPEEWKNKFDCALAFQTVEHSLSGMIFFNEMYRILAPGGRFYCEVPHFVFTVNENWHHISSPTPEQMKGWMMKLGFIEIEAEHIDNVPYAARWAFATGIKP